MHKTRVGFIGAGGIAQRHLGVLEQFEDVTIAGFTDVDPDRAQEAAGRFGTRAYPSVPTMFDAADLDAVYICVPPFAHGAPEQAALERGLPFLVEKPVSLDLTTARTIADSAWERGLITAVGYHWRYLDTPDAARASLAERPPRLVTGIWLDQTPPPRWWGQQDQGGGQIIEQTTHLIDLARVLVGEITEVFGLSNRTDRSDHPGLDVATASTATLRFASGAVGTLASTCLLRWPHRIGLHLFGDGLAIEISDHDIMIDVGEGRPIQRTEGDPVWREDRDFIDAVRGGPNHIRCPYPEALRTHETALAIERSIATGLPVTLIAREAEYA